ncbi:hypothetical protein HBQ40_05290, partial [Staphylococcus aureus]|nr:hypothetical protein [Staphylococcus aureus]
KVLNLVHMDFLNASSDFGNAHFVVLSKYIKEYESNYETASDDSLKEKLASRSLDLDK